MKPMRISEPTRTIAMNPGWGEEHGVQADELAVREVTLAAEKRGQTRTWMASAWRPTPEELAALNAGAPIIVWVSGLVHPILSLQLGDVKQ